MIEKYVVPTDVQYIISKQWTEIRVLISLMHNIYNLKQWHRNKSANLTDVQYIYNLKQWHK